jgi:hypothetical protein
MRERIVSIPLTPLLNNDVLLDVVEVLRSNGRDESLVFIGLVYTESVNNLGRRS